MDLFRFGFPRLYLIVISQVCCFVAISLCRKFSPHNYIGAILTLSLSLHSQPFRLRCPINVV